MLTTSLLHGNFAGLRQRAPTGVYISLLTATLFLSSLPTFAQTPTVQKVENGGLLFTDNNAGVSGTDAGFSIPMDTQTLWLFGDVFLLPETPARTYRGFVSNCGLLTAKGTGVEPLRRYTFLTDLKTQNARQLLPLAPGEADNVRLWPFGGWYAAPEKRVYLFYNVVRTTGGGALDFTSDGFGLASSDATDPTKIGFKRIPATPRQELWWKDTPGAAVFGNAVVSDRPGPYLYVVGVQSRNGRRYGKMARVPRKRVAEFAAYEYFAGTAATPRWSHAITDASDVEGLTDFPSELSVSYNAYLGGYLAAHSVGIDEKMRLSVAPNPWGPYKTVAEIGTPHRAFAKTFCYAGKEHPELTEQSGRIVYLTYVDGDRYWLHLLKVTLKR